MNLRVNNHRVSNSEKPQHLSPTRRTRRSAIVIGVATVLLTAVASPAVAQVGSSFHPEQCEIALAWSASELARVPGDRRARQARAEAWLCRGLLLDDRHALRFASARFARLAARDPADFFSRWHLGLALRRLYPLWSETEAVLAAARDTLDLAAVGAAKEQLATAVERDLSGVRSVRALHGPELARRLQAIAIANIGEASETLLVLAQTGPAGLRQARRTFNRLAAAAPADPTLPYYRAELARDSASSERLRRWYEAVHAGACGGAPVERFARQCDMIAERLRQLAAGADPDQ